MAGAPTGYGLRRPIVTSSRPKPRAAATPIPPYSNRLPGAARLGGPGADGGFGIAEAADATVWVVGSLDGNDAFVAAVDPNATASRFLRPLGGKGADVAEAVAVAPHEEPLLRDDDRDLVTGRVCARELDLVVEEACEIEQRGLRPATDIQRDVTRRRDGR